MGIEKEKILQTAERMYMRLGVRSVSMDDVSAELGISKKTLYQFVENKKDLVAQVLNAHIDEEKKAMAAIHQDSEHAIDELQKMARYVIRQLRQLSPNTIYDLKKYYRESWKMVESLHKDHVYGLMEKNLQWGISDELYRADIDLDIICKLYVGLSMLMVDEDIFPLAQYGKEKLFNEFIHFYIRGIASIKGLELLKKYQQ